MDGFEFPPGGVSSINTYQQSAVVRLEVAHPEPESSNSVNCPPIMLSQQLQLSQADQLLINVEISLPCFLNNLLSAPAAFLVSKGNNRQNRSDAAKTNIPAPSVVNNKRCLMTEEVMEIQEY